MPRFPLWLTLPLLSIVMLGASPAQTATVNPPPPAKVPISGHVQTLSGGQIADTVVNFTLYGCSSFQPRVFGVTQLVEPTFQVTPNSDGTIAATAWPNDVINCGGSTGTNRYHVQTVINGVPHGTPSCYQVASGTPFNLDTAMPCPSDTPPFGIPSDGRFTNITIPGTAALGTIIAGSINQIGNTVNASQQQGANLGEQIHAADLKLGSAVGVITVDSPGDITTGVPKMLPGHALYIRAPITTSATIVESDGNSVSCESPAASITSSTANLTMFDITTVHHFSLSGCTITNTASPNGSGIVVATGEASVGTSDIDVNHNVVTGSALLLTTGSGNQDIKVSNNTVTTSPMAAVLLVNTKVATIADNHFRKVAHGVQYWGGDSNGGYTGPDSVTLTGEIAMTGNTCDEIGGACLWGSMGYDITMTGNTAKGCGDICFDVEGTVRSIINNNVAEGCGNFCYAAFFGSVDMRFTGNIGTRPDTGIIAILKYSSGNAGPRHRNAVFEGNTFTFTGTQLGTAFYSEGDADLFYRNNTVTNGVWFMNGFHTHVTITNNDTKFTIVPPTPFTAYTFNGQILGESWLTFENNHTKLVPFQTINYPQFAAGSICAAASFGDFNNSDFFLFKHNQCTGFPTVFSTANLGLNTGPTAYPTMHTFISDNQMDHGINVHSADPVNGYVSDDYQVYPDNRLFDGSIAPYTVGNGTGGSGGGTLTASDINIALGYHPMNPAGVTMSGPLILAGAPTDPNGAVNKAYADALTSAISAGSISAALGFTPASSADNRLVNAVNKTGDTIPGQVLAPDPLVAQQLATKHYVDVTLANATGAALTSNAIVAALGFTPVSTTDPRVANALQRNGDTVNGHLLAPDPTDPAFPQQVATRSWVLAQIGGGNTATNTLLASDIGVKVAAQDDPRLTNALQASAIGNTVASFTDTRLVNGLQTSAIGTTIPSITDPRLVNAVSTKGSVMQGQLQVPTPVTPSSAATISAVQGQIGPMVDTALAIAKTEIAFNHLTCTNGADCWAAGINFYPGVFAADTTLAMSQFPSNFTATQVQGVLDQLETPACQGGWFPNGFLSGSPNQYYCYTSFQDQSAQAFPDGEGQWWVPVLEKLMFDKTGSTAHFDAHKAAIETSLALIPVNVTTGLVKVDGNANWVPFLFQEIAQHTGDVLVGSLFYYRTATIMAGLYTAEGDATNAGRWNAVASKVAASLNSTSSPLWDATDGMFYATTGQNRQVDIIGSSLALSLGLGSGPMKTSISTFLNNRFDARFSDGQPIFRYGMAAQVWDPAHNNSWQFRATSLCGANNTPCGDGQYQNGFWNVGNRWILDALAYGNRSNAIQYAIDAITVDPNREYINQFDGGKGTSPNLESATGTLSWVMDNGTAFAGALPGSLGIVADNISRGFGTNLPCNIQSATLDGTCLHYLNLNGRQNVMLGSPVQSLLFNYNPITGENYFYDVDFTAHKWFFKHHPVSGPDTIPLAVVDGGIEVNGQLITGAPTTPASTAIAYGTPTMIGPTGASLAPTDDWIETDNLMTVVYTPGGNPGDVIPGGGLIANVQFGKQWKDTIGGHPVFPNCQVQPRLTSTGDIRVVPLGNKGGPNGSSQPGPATLELWTTSGSSLVAGTTYAWTVHCDATAEE